MYSRLSGTFIFGNFRKFYFLDSMVFYNRTTSKTETIREKKEDDDTATKQTFFLTECAYT